MTRAKGQMELFHLAKDKDCRKRWLDKGFRPVDTQGVDPLIVSACERRIQERRAARERELAERTPPPWLFDRTV